MSASSNRQVAHKSQARSRVTNGSVFDPSKVDGRSALARRYRDILSEMIRDLGGDPSAAQDAIARRAATLCVWCEQAEATMASGGEINISEFSTTANAMRRLLVDLGLERRARDVTPSLSNYLNRSA